MSGIAGYKGNVLWQSDAVVLSDSAVYLSDATHKLYSWKLDLTADPLNDTDFSSTGWKTFLSGLKGWTSSVEAFIDDTNQMAVSDVGSSAILRLYEHVSDASIGNLIWKGTAICTGVHPSVAVDGIETQTIDFQGTGALVKSDV